MEIKKFFEMALAEATNAIAETARGDENMAAILKGRGAKIECDCPVRLEGERLYAVTKETAGNLPRIRIALNIEKI